MRTIGFLSSGSQNAFNGFLADFRGGMASEGFVDGRDVTIISKWADGDYARLWSMAADLVNAGVDVIATTGGLVSAQAAVGATEIIPILFISGYDAQQVEFASGTKGPPDNATGVSVEATDKSQRRLEKFRRLLGDHGKSSKIGLLVRPNTTIAQLEVQAAHKLNLAVIFASTADDLSEAFASARMQKLDGLMVAADPFYTSKRDLIIALAKQSPLPTAYAWREYPIAGGLMSFGAHLPTAYNQIGIYAGQILKVIAQGYQPSSPLTKDYKLVRYMNEELVINAQAVQDLGLTIPPDLHAEAEIV